MKREEKEEIVNQLAEQLGSYKFVYLTDTADLTAKSVNSLRRELFKQGIKMQVAKNTLIKKAIEKSGLNYGGIVDTLKGSSSLFFSDDAKTPAKAIKEFRKKNPKPVLKGAYIDSDIFLGDAAIEDLLALKSRQELIGDVIMLLQSTMSTVMSQLQSGGNTTAGLVKTLSEKEN